MFFEFLLRSWFSLRWYWFMCLLYNGIASSKCMAHATPILYSLPFLFLSGNLRPVVRYLSCFHWALPVLLFCFFISHLCARFTSICLSPDLFNCMTSFFHLGCQKFKISWLVVCWVYEPILFILCFHYSPLLFSFLVEWGLDKRWVRVARPPITDAPILFLNYGTKQKLYTGLWHLLTQQQLLLFQLWHVYTHSDAQLSHACYGYSAHHSIPIEYHHSIPIVTLPDSGTHTSFIVVACCVNTPLCGADTNLGAMQ